MGRATLTAPPTGLEAEILAEKLATYVRIARTLERLAAEARAARMSIPAAAGLVRDQRVAAFERLRGRAERHLWYLIVQREALGLRHHDGLERHYPIPARVAAGAPPDPRP